MSTVIAKNVQVGTSGTATDNFTLYQPATPDGTVRLANGNSGTTTDLVAVTSAGNVGIGTSSPGTKLDVGLLATGTLDATHKGNVRIQGLQTTLASQGGLEFKMTEDGYGAKIQTISSGGTNLVFAARNASSTWVERARIDSSGNFLVGATSGPSTNTRVYASATTQDDNNGIIQAASSSNSASIIAKTPIGTAQFFQWETYGVRIGSRAMSGANAGAIYFSTGNDAVAASLEANRIFKVGDVGPGAAGSAMTVYGGSGGDIVQFHQNRNSSTPYWYFNTSGSYGVFSDARLKDNITEVSQADSVGFVQKLKPVEFSWKPEFGNANQRISGFIAQDVLKAAKTEGQKNILTHWEAYDEADPECPKMGLSDHRLLPSIVGALQHALSTIQEQQAIITQLQADVSALKAASV